MQTLRPTRNSHTASDGTAPAASRRCGVCCCGAIGLLMVCLPAFARGQLESDSSAAGRNRSVQFVASLGMGFPAGETRCMTRGYLIPGFAVQTLGRFFVMAGAEWLQPWGPVEDCLRLPSIRPHPEGGILVRGDDRIDFGGALHAGAGLGASIPMGAVSGEARLGLGVAAGQDEFGGSLLPSLAVALGFSFFRNHLVVAFEQRWFHVPHWTKRYASEQEWYDEGSYARPSGAITQRDWKRFSGLNLGFRF